MQIFIKLNTLVKAWSTFRNITTKHIKKKLLLLFVNDIVFTHVVMYNMYAVTYDDKVMTHNLLIKLSCVFFCFNLSLSGLEKYFFINQQPCWVFKEYLQYSIMSQV